MIMKRFFTQWSAIALGCLVLGFSSCSKDDGDDATPSIPDGPKITFTAPGLTVTDGAINVSVTQDSTLVVKYSVEAAGKIKDLEQTVDGTSETVAAANDKTSYSRDIILNLPFEDKSIVIEVEVTDENDKSATAKVTINVGAIIPPGKELTPAAAIIMGGNNSAEFFSRWDLDLPEGYSGWSLRNSGDYAAFVPHIDIFYTSNSVANSHDENFAGGHPTESGPMWPNGFGSFFAKTDLTRAEFDAMTNDVELMELTINSAKVEDITPGTVVAFITAGGRRGLLYFDVKVEATDDWDVLHKIQVAE